MYPQRLLLLFVSFFGIAVACSAQMTCPPNIDFEQGLGNWLFYTGSCCPINANTFSGPIVNRHTLTTGTGTDPYGNFPIVAPGGGLRSLKLGNNSVNAQAERARYYVKVPAGVNNYSLLFRFAVVFENPGHVAADQPRFEIKAYDSLTNAILPCVNFTYVATANIPGFALSPTGNNVWYRPWTTGMINLSGYGGKTIAIDFASGDCNLGGHFGYGYVDMNCSLFQIAYNSCSYSPTTTLTAPPGYQSYQWTNANYTPVGTGETITISTPPTSTVYHVILAPFNGFGCPDTLHATVNVTSLMVNATDDTTLCNGGSIPLSSGAAGNALPLTYSWAPATGLSCTNCANPVATPTSNTTYYVTVQDANGCVKNDSVKIKLGHQLATTVSNVSCNGGNDGSGTAVVSGGTPPYSYSWNTTPIQTTSVATSLSAGTYMVSVSDAAGCIKNAQAIVAQPAVVSATISNMVPVNCNGGSNGSATAIVSGGTATYSYSWNSNPVQTTSMLSNVAAGSYLLTVTDSKGCIATASVTITQPPPLTANISASTNVSCFGGNNGNVSVTVYGGNLPYSYQWNTSPVQTSSTASNLQAGAYNVIVTDNNGCTVAANTTITQPAALITSASILNNVLCFGGAHGAANSTVTGGTPPYSYSWNSMPVQNTAALNSVGAGNYVLSVTDNNGCQSTSSVSITQPALLTASILSINPVNCFGGNNGAAMVSVSGGTSPYAYSWNTSPIQTNSNATNLSAGSYIATVTDNNGCTANATAVITQPNVLSLNITSVTPVSCFNGNNGSANSSVSGGTAPYIYSWNSNPVQTTSNLNSVPAGSYTLTVTDSKGCVANATAVIQQPQVLDASILSVLPVSCYGGNNGGATVNHSGGTGPYTYSWNTVPVKTTATANGLSAGSYIVTVTDSKGCSDTAHVTVTEPTSLNLNIVSVNPVTCSNASNGSISVTAGGGTLPYAYSWNTSPVQTSSNAVNLPIGNYTCTVTDNNGCSKSVSSAITYPNPLIGSLSGVTHLQCYGDSNGTASVNATGGYPPYSFLWNSSPAQTISNATGLTAGSYTATITDSAGCAVPVSVTILQPAEIKITNITTNTCPGMTEGTASANVSGGTSPYSVLWNTVPAQSGTLAQQLAAGKYLITVTDGKGCVKTDTVAINNFPEPVISAGPDTILCEGRKIQLLASGGVSYLWSPATSLSCTNCTSPYANPFETTVYRVTGTDQNNCKATDEVKITVVHRVPVSVGPDIEICEGESVRLSATGGESYNWLPSASLNNSGIAQPTAAPEATTKYQVVIKENVCFYDTLFQNVTVYPYPAIDLGPDFNALPGAVVQLEAKTTNAISILWTPTIGLSCADCYNPIANVESTITYKVEVQNKLGCKTVDELTIDVSCSPSSFFMANTFTPNGDGLNDVFFPQGRGINVVNSFMVFNRWGEKVFDARNFPCNNKSYGWNGSFKNVPLPPDVYVYMVEASCENSERIMLKGDITLIR